MKEPELAKLDQALQKLLTAMRSEGKSVTGPMIIGKAVSFIIRQKYLISEYSPQASCKI
jgi:hypothetical protein